MSRRSIVLAALALALISSGATADYLEVRRAVTLKSEPHGDAVVLERLDPGRYLDLLEEEQTSGYYFGRSPESGNEGWVYRSFVRRYDGDPPMDEVDNYPLADPGLVMSAEERAAAARHLSVGKPVALYERVHEAYVSAQDGRFKVPLWVQYELRPQDIHGPAPRHGNFRQDTSIPRASRASDDDYTNSGYDRGHMAPADHMDRSEEAMYDSFLLSNACPQVGTHFNSHIWAYLEAAVLDWVDSRGSLIVITGPIFENEGDAVSFETIGEGQVAVPHAFYKIVVDAKDPSSAEALAFRMPNAALEDEDYEDYLTSIDEIEVETGLDFLSALPDDVERAVERVTAEQVW